LRWAEPDAERLAGAIFLVAIKGLGGAHPGFHKGSPRKLGLKQHLWETYGELGELAVFVGEDGDMT